MWKLVRLGLGLLAAAAIVVLLDWVMAMVVGSPDVNRQTVEYARQQQGVAMWWGIIYLICIALMVPGLMALTILLSQRNHSGLGLLGLVTGSISLALTAGVMGALSLGGAVIAGIYLQGNTGMLVALQQFEGGNLAPLLNNLFAAAMVLALIAGVAYGIGMWRSSVAKWIAIVLPLGFLLVATSIPFTSLPGGILLAVAAVILMRTRLRSEEASVYSERMATT